MTLSRGARELVRSFGDCRLLVFGDVILDEWVTGAANRLAREAPVPTVAVGYRESVPGGAGNAALNTAALGGRVRVLTALGDDQVGAELREQLQRRGVEVVAKQVARRRTQAKRRLVADGHVVARFDEGDCAHVGEAVDEALARTLVDLAEESDALLVCDYAAGACRGPAVHKAVELVARRRPVLIDAHDLRPWAHARAALVTPNWSEASQLIGQGSELRGVARIAAVDVMADRLLQVTGARQVVVTLDADGAVLIRADGLRHQPTRRIADAHSAGAGDTAAAALALGLAAGSDLHDALELAVAAATVVVQRPGTATCSQRDLAAQEHLLTVEQLVRACDEHRAIGRRIAFTNGCFDVLHAGHIACLREAAAAADVVVVGLNDDAGVRSIKGPGRPVNRLPDRAEVLAALDTVDHLVAFDGATPLGLIEAITPDVYVKGADHDVSRLPEAQAVRSLGGVVHTVTLLPDRSTSGVIAACAASLEATG